MTRLFMTFAIALTTTACESVPNLSFNDATDQGIGDAQSDAEPDGAGKTDGALVDAATDSSSFVDASTPGDAAVPSNTCPTIPSWATSCCGAASQTCNGKCDPGNCTKCQQQCGAQELCCTNKKLTCVKLGEACPP